MHNGDAESEPTVEHLDGCLLLHNEGNYCYQNAVVQAVLSWTSHVCRKSFRRNAPCQASHASLLYVRALLGQVNLSSGSVHLRSLKT